MVDATTMKFGDKFVVNDNTGCGRYKLGTEYGYLYGRDGFALVYPTNRSDEPFRHVESEFYQRIADGRFARVIIPQPMKQPMKEGTKVTNKAAEFGFIEGAYRATVDAAKEMAPAVIGQQGIDAAVDAAAKYFRDAGSPQAAEFISSKAGRDIFRVVIPAVSVSAAGQFPDNTIAKHLGTVMTPTLKAGVFMAERDLFQELVMPMVAAMLKATGFDTSSFMTPKLAEGSGERAETMPEQDPATLAAQ